LPSIVGVRGNKHREAVETTVADQASEVIEQLPIFQCVFFSDSVSAFPPALRMCVWCETISPLITKGFAMLRNLCAWMFRMKKYLTTLLVAALPIIHAQAADLENQLPGYWQPDMTKTLALAKRDNRRIDPMAEVMMGKMVFEFQKDKMITHGPPGMTSDAPPLPYAIKRVDKTANSLTLIAGGKEMMVRFHGGQWRCMTRRTAGSSSTA
jgi:hypothetical protein